MNFALVKCEPPPPPPQPLEEVASESPRGPTLPPELSTRLLPDMMSSCCCCCRPNNQSHSGACSSTGLITTYWPLETSFKRRSWLSAFCEGGGCFAYRGRHSVHPYLGKHCDFSSSVLIFVYGCEVLSESMLAGILLSTPDSVSLALLSWEF